MTKKKINETTLNDLAHMVASGFESVEEKMATKEDLKEVKVKLVEHDMRFGKLEFKIDEMHDILNRFEEGDILDLQKRIKILERTVKAIAKQL